MPRTVPSGLLQSQTRCIAVKVVRQDGTVFGLTDTNVEFTWLGVDYKFVNGHKASNIEQSAGTSPGDLEISTIEGMVATQITRRDLLANFYELCRVWVYEIDYLNPGNGALIKGQYIMTKAVLHDTGMVITLKEILYLLKQATGDSIGSTCRVKTTFDKQCDPSGLLKALYTYSRTVTNVVDTFTFDVTESNPVGWYNFGVVESTAGANLGCPTADIKVHLTPSAGVARIVLSTPYEYPIVIGDLVNLTRGCSRLGSNCEAIANTAATNPSGTNIENFQGENTMPAPDDMNRVGRQAGM